MKAASDEIRRTVNPDFDLARMPDDDSKTYEMISRGETLGMFQLESDGMKRVCTELRPSRLEDVIALVALYRPGPMEWIPNYINIKHGRKQPTYLHAKLEPILAETYSIPCYQEQVMQIARDVAGFTMGEADELRKVDGEKAERKDSHLSPKVRRRLHRERHRREAGRRYLPVRRTVCGIRIQQIARRSLRLDRLSDRVSEGQLSAAVFRSADVVGPQQYRQARRVHRRGEEDGYPGAAAGRQRVAG